MTESQTPQPPNLPVYTIVEASEFSFGLIIRTALHMLRNNLFLFLAIIFLIDIPLRMLPLSLTPNLGDPAMLMQDMPRLLVAAVMFTLIRLFPAAMIYRIAGDMVVGERRLLSSILGRCLYRYPVVVIAALIYGAAAFVGLLALILPGIIILVFGCCYAPAAVIREHGVIDSLTNSVRLVKGNFGNVFAVQLGLFVGLLVVNLMVIGVSALIALAGLEFISEMLALFLLALIELFALLVNAALFFNLEGIQRARSGAMTTNAS